MPGVPARTPAGALVEIIADRDVDMEAALKPGSLKEMALGDPNAPVKIIEYMSMTCPHCQNFHLRVLPHLKKTYIDAGKVKTIVAIGEDLAAAGLDPEEEAPRLAQASVAYDSPAKIENDEVAMVPLMAWVAAPADRPSISAAPTMIPASNSKAPAPTTQRSPTLIWSRNVALTPIKHCSPIETPPDTTICDAKNVWSFITE